jgi:hypothetical protein
LLPNAELRVVVFDERLDGGCDVGPPDRRGRCAHRRLLLSDPGHGDDQVLAVLGGRTVDEPGRQVLAFVNQPILGLRRADAVVVEGLPGQGGFERLACRRLRVA